MVAGPHPRQVLEVLRGDLAVFDVAFREALDAVIQEQLDALGDALALVLRSLISVKTLVMMAVRAPLPMMAMMIWFIFR